MATATAGGTAAIELGLLAPALVFLFVGVVDFGRYLCCCILATHAANAGAQFGAQNVMTAASSTAMISAALRDAPALQGASASAVHTCMLGNVAVACNITGATYYVQVRVTGTFQALINYPGIPSSIPISATALLRVASQ